MLTLTKQPNTNPATPDTQPNFGLIEPGGERWRFLKSLARLRHAVKFYNQLDLNTINDDKIWQTVDTLKYAQNHFSTLSRFTISPHRYQARLR